MVNQRRGGRGTNQYSVKPKTATEQEQEVKNIHDFLSFSAPKRNVKQEHLNGVDARLVSILNRCNGDSGDQEGAENELRRGYPTAYADALINNSELRDEATDAYDATIDEMTEMIASNGSEDNPMRNDTARISALIAVSARDSDGRGSNLVELNERVTRRNREFMNNLCF